MPKNHLKAHNAPKTWDIKRKNMVFVTRPNPGAHKIDFSMPINLVLKRMLKKATTNKEVKKILHDQEVLVNGKKRKDYRYPVGLLDVITFPLINESFIMLINKFGKLYFNTIDKKNADVKLSKISGKKILGKDKIQLQTFDGRSILVKKDDFKTGDTLVISIPKQEIKDIIKLEKGAKILIYSGKYIGQVAEVVEIKDDVLTFKSGKEMLETKRQYAIVIGKDKPIINIE